ncbi:MAG: DUF177 domain-containing protein [Clostridia bacterium]|nr:DUF177 domain-containing protein [Clostridia bacterium]MBQ8289511.1 DUF177 domain-containing protein [Clostridia bacterium]
MRLDLRPLLSGDKLLTFDFDLSLDRFSEDTSAYLNGVSFPSPMKVSGRITNTAGYMLLTLSLSVDYSTVCARCLEPIEGSFALDLEKTVASKDMAEDIPEERLDDYVIIEDGSLNLDEQLIEQLEMEFPSKILCKDDCLGLCPRCGRSLNHTSCDCGKDDIDPRLLPFKALLDKMDSDGDNQD